VHAARPGAGPAAFSGLHGLHTLRLYQTEVVSLDGLTGLSQLKELGVNTDVGVGHLTDEGTGALTTLTGLERLELPIADITDPTLARLAGLKQLRFLNLSYASGVSDTALAALAGLKGLEHLDLSTEGWRRQASITDEGLRNLAGLTTLIVLKLGGHSITDAGLVHLRALKKLEWLDLGTRATPRGAQELLAFLPKASILAGGAMVKHENPHPHFTRRDVDGQASFEVPDDWEVLDWQTFEQFMQIFEKPLVEQFQARLQEGGYKHGSGGWGSAAPGEVQFNRFPALGRQLETIYRAFIRWGTSANIRPGTPTRLAHALPGTETLSWRYRTDNRRVQRLDFAWRREDTCYLMRCQAPASRFAGLESIFLHTGQSFRFSTDDPPAGEHH
jgi:hypothetical protein